MLVLVLLQLPDDHLSDDERQLLGGGNRPPINLIEAAGVQEDIRVRVEQHQTRSSRMSDSPASYGSMTAAHWGVGCLSPGEEDSTSR